MKYLLIVSVLLTGCATTRYETFSEDDYKYYSSIMAGSERCFELNNVSTSLMSQTQHNLGVVLSIRDYNKTKLNRLYYAVKSQIGLRDSETIDCKRVELEMRNVIAHGERIQHNQTIQASQPQPNYFPNTKSTVFCNKIGTMTLCN